MLVSPLWRRMLGLSRPVDPVTSPYIPIENHTQKLVIRNSGSEIIEVMVEIIPDRYILRPGQEMVVEVDLDGAPYDITTYEFGIQIYPGNGWNPTVLIDGVVAETDWTTESLKAK